jgi:hypothetical protein
MIAGEAAERLLQRYRASALFVLESGDVWITPDWQDAVRLAALTQGPVRGIAGATVRAPCWHRCHRQLCGCFPGLP